MRRLALLAVIAIFAASGCTIISVDGGGWMANKDGGGNGKATFGFDIRCDFESNRLNGTWVYQDKDAGINAHGTLTDDSGGWKGSYPTYVRETGLRCTPQFGTEYDSAGLRLVYESRPCAGGVCEGGIGYVDLDDNGKQGPDKGDELAVEFLTGPYAGYENDQVIGGGQLNVDAY